MHLTETSGAKHHSNLLLKHPTSCNTSRITVSTKQPPLALGPRVRAYGLLNDTVEVHMDPSTLPKVGLGEDVPVKLLVSELLDERKVDGHLFDGGVEHLEPHDAACA